MDITRDITCKGCGSTGKTVWRQDQWSSTALPVLTPVQAFGTFYLHQVEGGLPVIACSRCQQIQSPR